jgi:NDP-sugar pyrophosphorylase family protein/aminoglycoside/choline kinase family phosphotransferase
VERSTCAVAGLDVLLLAAGFGTRLEPLTRQIPKALLPLCGTPLLDHHIARLPQVRRIVVNAHHLAPLIEAHLAAHRDRARLTLSHEPVILGTGGALAHAADRLRSDPVLVQNADAFFNVPLDPLLEFHRSHGFLATLVLARSTLWPNVEANDDRVIALHPGKCVPGAYTFTGCHLVSQELIARLPRDGFHDIRETYAIALREGRLGAFLWPPAGQGALLDLGTPAAYLEAHRLCALDGGKRFGLTAPGQPADRAPEGFGTIDPTAQVGENCRIAESVVLPRAELEPGCTLRRVIVGPGARVAGHIENRMITTLGVRLILPGPEIATPAPQPAPGPPAAPVPDAGRAEAAAPAAFVARTMSRLAGQADLTPAPPQSAARKPAAQAPGDSTARPSLERLAGDGSMRTLYRVRHAGLRAVLVANPLPAARMHPDENEGFLAVREHLDQRQVRVPAFYAADLDAGYLLLEDLGDLRLYEQVRAAGWADPPREIALYEHALRLLVRMQAPGAPPFRLSLVPNPPYTRAFVLAAEAAYFHTEFVLGLAGLRHAFDAIAPECREIARMAFEGIREALLPAADPVDRIAWDALTATEVEQAGLTFMHRDYQSRNLMVVEDTLAVIDFQGARLGPPEYDLAALAYDPYAAMPAREREALLRFYLREAAASGVPGVPPEPTAAWRRRFLANAANRLLQALGAFAKLGGRLGRPGFLEHVPVGLSHLHAVLTELDSSPTLRDLIAQLRLCFPEATRD